MPQLRDQIEALVQQVAGQDTQLERTLRRKLENWAINRGSGRAMGTKARLHPIVFERQKGLCDVCSLPLPDKGWEMDRLSADFHDESDQGYRLDNVRAVHSHCHPRGPHPAGRRPGVSNLPSDVMILEVAPTDPRKNASGPAEVRARSGSAMTDEVKGKIRQATKAYWATHEHPMKGRQFSHQAKENMRAGQAARKARLAGKG
jgi:hypothetical protein